MSPWPYPRTYTLRASPCPLCGGNVEGTREDLYWHMITSHGWAAVGTMHLRTGGMDPVGVDDVYTTGQLVAAYEAEL